ncbi:MAG: molybdate ABC transporter substrate-binding protein [Solirubrobacteraceae bacterium]
MRRTTLATILAVALGLAIPAGAQALTVYAATSLTSVFPAMDKGPSYSFGGSNTLQLQIERGGPADVFASASPTEAQTLFREGLCTRPVTFAINRLVLLIPNDNPGNVTSVYSLRSGGRKLSVGTAGVPIGAYTRALLKRLRLSSILSSNTVSQQTNVGQVSSQVALGAADAGFVYYTDGLAVKDRTRMISLPKWSQPPVRYQICAVRRDGADTSGAQAFIKEVTGKAGRAALKGYGFGLPPRK